MRSTFWGILYKEYKLRKLSKMKIVAGSYPSSCQLGLQKCHLDGRLEEKMSQISVFLECEEGTFSYMQTHVHTHSTLTHISSFYE